LNCIRYNCCLTQPSWGCAADTHCSYLKLCPIFRNRCYLICFLPLRIARLWMIIVDNLFSVCGRGICWPFHIAVVIFQPFHKSEFQHHCQEGFLCHLHLCRPLCAILFLNWDHLLKRKKICSHSITDSYCIWPHEGDCFHCVLTLFLLDFFQSSLILCFLSLSLILFSFS
jgi:hypothetical protein